MRPRPSSAHQKPNGCAVKPEAVHHTTGRQARSLRDTGRSGSRVFRSASVVREAVGNESASDTIAVQVGSPDGVSCWATVEWLDGRLLDRTPSNAQSYLRL